MGYVFMRGFLKEHVNILIIFNSIFGLQYNNLINSMAYHNIV